MLDQGNLFNRFIQGHKKISIEYGGSGLGLAICKKLAEKMGGKITFESEKDKGQKISRKILTHTGSSFTFTSKCTITEPPTMLTPTVATPKETEDNKLTILIVEDNIVNQRILVNYLKQNNYICDTAVNGKEAVEKYEKSSFHLVFMDVEMPIMNGLDATKMIRQIEKDRVLKAVPIVGLSGR